MVTADSISSGPWSDGVNWNKIKNSLDVFAMHHNILSRFMNMQIGLCSMGEGSVTFKNFKYQPLAQLQIVDIQGRIVRAI